MIFFTFWPWFSGRAPPIARSPLTPTGRCNCRARDIVSIIIAMWSLAYRTENAPERTQKHPFSQPVGDIDLLWPTRSTSPAHTAAIIIFALCCTEYVATANFVTWSVADYIATWCSTAVKTQWRCQRSKGARSGWLRSTVGRTPVFGRQTDPVLRSACSRRVTSMWVNYRSANYRSTQPFIPPGSINE